MNNLGEHFPEELKKKVISRPNPNVVKSLDTMKEMFDQAAQNVRESKPEPLNVVGRPRATFETADYLKEELVTTQLRLAEAHDRIAHLEAELKAKS